MPRNMITMRGSIPSIKSNQVKMAVQKFTDFDRKSVIQNDVALKNAIAFAKYFVDKSTEKVRLS